MGRMTIMAAGLGLATVLAGACGGGDDAGALVGTWQTTDPDTGDVTNTLTLEDGGNFTLVEVEDGNRTTTGTYEADGETMTMHGTDSDGVTADLDFSYYVNDTSFMLGALLPQGDVSGVVGTWKGHVKAVSDSPDDTPLDETDTYDLQDDGSVSLHAVTPDQTLDITGTWVMDGADAVTATFEQDGFTINIHMQLLDGAALGGPVYARADDAGSSSASARRSSAAGPIPSAVLSSGASPRIRLSWLIGRSSTSSVIPPGKTR